MPLKDVVFDKLNNCFINYLTSQLNQQATTHLTNQRTKNMIETNTEKLILNQIITKFPPCMETLVPVLFYGLHHKPIESSPLHILFFLESTSVFYSIVCSVYPSGFQDPTVLCMHFSCHTCELHA